MGDPEQASGQTPQAGAAGLTPQAGAAGVAPQAGTAGARASAPPPSEPGRDVADEDFLYHLYRGSELLQDERVHEAKEELEQALTYQPRDARGQDLLGVVYFRLGLFSRAIQIYETLRNQNPKEPSVRLNLALCYMKTTQTGRAREELETLVRTHPDHRRAWGYLGLCYERLGDAARAREAFERGGHTQMAQRVAHVRADARASARPPRPTEPPPAADAPHRDAQQVAAFQELDAGELSFSLAAPAEASAAQRRMSSPGAAPSIAELVLPPVARVPAIRAQVTLPAPEAIVGGAFPSAALPSAVPEAARAATDAPEFARTARLPFPTSPGVVLDRGLVLVTTSTERPFATRLEALRSYTGPITSAILARQARDKPTGEPLGGVGTPVVKIGGESHLVLGARQAHAIVALHLDGVQPACIREERILGFELTLAYDSHRLSADRDGVRVVQLKGSGVIVLELLGTLGGIAVGPSSSATVRRDAIVGWLGPLVARPLLSGEAPAGQRGLVTFVGDGTVLVAS